MENNFNNSGENENLNNQNNQNFEGGCNVSENSGLHGNENKNMNGYQPLQNTNNQNYYYNNCSGNYNNSSNRLNNKPKNTGMAIASMIIGIVSVVFFCAWYISIPCAVLAVVFGGISLHGKKGNQSMALTGVITGVAGLIISIIYTIVVWMWTLDVMRILFNAEWIPDQM